MLLGKVNKSKIGLTFPYLFSNVEDKKDTIDNVFNVQHDKLVIKSVHCCHPRRTKNISISGRLKREAGDIPPCTCLGHHSRYGRYRALWAYIYIFHPNSNKHKT